jgi:acetoin utilization protein AcuB
MLIQEFMTPNPLTIDEETSILEAAARMKEKKIRRFPVLRGDRLVGIVTDRDLRSAAPSQVISFDQRERELLPELHEMLSGIRVKTIMSQDLITAGPAETIVTASRRMLRHRISGMPVTDALGRLVGIITEGDIFKALVKLAGGSLGNTLLGFALEDRPGSIKEVADVIRAHGGRLASILTSYETTPDPALRHVYIRIRDMAPDKLKALRDELAKRFRLLYMIEEEEEPVPAKS